MAKILGIVTAVLLAISAIVAIKNNARFKTEIENAERVAQELERNTNNLKNGKGTDKDDIKIGKKRAQVGGPSSSILALGP